MELQANFLLRPSEVAPRNRAKAYIGGTTAGEPVDAPGRWHEVGMKTKFHAPVLEELQFSADGFRLHGSLHLPASRPAPLVVGCHGLLSDRRSPKQIALAEACRRQGMAYFRFDHRGCGDSEGHLETDTSLDGRVSDLLHAVRHLYRRPDIQKRLGLFGSSMGGAVCIRAAVRASAAAIATCAAPVRSRLLKAAFEAAGPHGGRALPLLKDEFDLIDDLPKIGNLLVFHGDADEVVPVAHAHEIIQGAADPKRLIIQKGGDHPMSDPRHQQAFIRTATLWFHQALVMAAAS
jgi:alpha/beta superfamily hydrolase